MGLAQRPAQDAAVLRVAEQRAARRAFPPRRPRRRRARPCGSARDATAERKTRREPGSQSRSSRSTGRERSVGGGLDEGEPRAHARPRGTARRCGRRSRTSSRSPSAAARCAPAGAPRRARSRGRGPRRAPPSPASAGRLRSRRASTVATASTAPAAPSRWPIADLSEETGTSRARSPSALLDGLGLRAVVQRRGGAMRVDPVDLSRLDAGVAQRERHGPRRARARPARARSGGGRRRWRR